MKTLRVMGKLKYDKCDKNVTEMWEDRPFCTYFPIKAYMGVLRRVVFRTNYFLATVYKRRPYK